MTTDRHDFDALLRSSGLRVTDSRRAVLRALQDKPHATAEDVFSLVSAHSPDANRQSIYNALADFAGAGLARRIEPAGHAARFELRVGDNHHHVVCSGCGRIDDVDCVVGHAPCLEPAGATEFALDQAEVTFWGRCPDCRTTHADEAPLVGSR